jgi:hypothetical protein
VAPSRNDHDVALAADPQFVAKAKLQLALEHPHDLLVCVTVRLNMDASSDAPPYEHPLITGENATAIFSLICSAGKAANVPKPTSVGITSSQIRIDFGVAWSMPSAG